MFALVLYTASKTKDIVEKQNIKYPRGGQGDVKVLHGNKYFNAKIVKESDSKQWLETLTVSKDGKVSLNKKSAAKSDEGATAKANNKADIVSKKNVAKKIDVEVLEKSISLKKKMVDEAKIDMQAPKKPEKQKKQTASAANEKKRIEEEKMKVEAVVGPKSKKNAMTAPIGKQPNKKCKLVGSDSDGQQDEIESSHQKNIAGKSKTTKKMSVKETVDVQRPERRVQCNDAMEREKKTPQVTKGKKRSLIVAEVEKKRMTFTVENRMNKKRKWTYSENDEQLMEIETGRQENEAVLHDEEDKAQDEMTRDDDYAIESDEEKENEEDEDMNGKNREDDEHNDNDTEKAGCSEETVCKKNAAKKIDDEVLEKTKTLRNKWVGETKTDTKVPKIPEKQKKQNASVANKKKPIEVEEAKVETIVGPKLKNNGMTTPIGKGMKNKCKSVDSDSDGQKDGVESRHQGMVAENSKTTNNISVKETKGVQNSKLQSQHNSVVEKKKIPEVMKGKKESVIVAEVEKKRLGLTVENQLNKKRKSVDSENDEELVEVENGRRDSEAVLYDEDDKAQDEIMGVDDHEIESDETEENKSDEDTDEKNREGDDRYNDDTEEVSSNEEDGNKTNNDDSVKKIAGRSEDDESRPSKKRRHLTWLDIMSEQLPPISADTVKYFKFFAEFLETKYGDEAKTNALQIDDMTGSSTSPNLRGLSSIGGETKVEILRNSGIHVEKADLENVLEFDGNPRSMVRRLMRIIVGDAELRKMSAGGRSNRPGIPKDVKKVVFKFVRQNMAEGVAGLTPQEYTRTLNLMCSTLRSQAKSTAVSTAKTAGSTDLH